MFAFQTPAVTRRLLIAGFAAAEADRFFGRPQSVELAGLKIRLRPPKDVRADYVRRHATLLSAT